MNNGGRLRIEREWLDKALQIPEKLPRQLFMYACLGKAFQSPQYEGAEGFKWPEVQILWERTKITPLANGEDGYIKFE